MGPKSSLPETNVTPESAPSAAKVLNVKQHILEVVSDSGEGAQKCGQSFGLISAKMGNGVWTVEIIPAEIQPPVRTPGSASGVRIRLGEEKITNWGDEANVVIAFNEQVLLSRHRLGALADDAVILIESYWENHDDETIRRAWSEAMEEMSSASYRFIKVPMHENTLKVTDNPKRGKNMFALGVVSWIYNRDMEKVRAQIAEQFRKKGDAVIKPNIELVNMGAEWASKNIDFRIQITSPPLAEDMVVMNGNQAVGLGAIASGMELCSMYPITPATSVSHGLGDIFETYGGIVHQAEDEIAAVGVAVGASFAGNVAFTVTSGPGLALKTEFIGLAVMTETPLVLVDVQRGGPSTGLPTKVEQSDLLAAIFGQPGDAPHVVMAPATIEDCFHVMVTARRIAEAFRTVVMVLTDANLATGVQPFIRPKLDARWHAAPLNLEAVSKEKGAYEWDPQTGLSQRFIPGQPEGMFTATGLAHDRRSKVAYDPETNEVAMNMRSRKMAVLQSMLTPPAVHGDEEGDLLVVGWGSTKGAIEEAVDRARAMGHKVGSAHLTFLSPIEPGLKDIFRRYKKVITVEINYSDSLDDPYITPDSRRRGQLCWLLRAHTLEDVGCHTRVPGQPLRPNGILRAIIQNLDTGVTV